MTVSELKERINHEQATEDGAEFSESEHGYVLMDLSEMHPDRALETLRYLDKSGNYVYHGMHNNEFRRQAGIDDVRDWESLDPAHSHQPEGRKAVYATDFLEGGLVHATLLHRPEDLDPKTGETYSIKVGASTVEEPYVEVSPSLARGIKQEKVFTPGLLYVLPAEQFAKSGSSPHEVVANERVIPEMVVRVGADLGQKLVSEQPPDIRTE